MILGLYWVIGGEWKRQWKLLFRVLGIWAMMNDDGSIEGCARTLVIKVLSAILCRDFCLWGSLGLFIGQTQRQSRERRGAQTHCATSITM